MSSLTVAELDVLLVARLDQFKREMDRGEAIVEKFADKADAASKDASNRVERNIEGLARKYDRIGRAMTLGMTLPIAGITGAALKGAGDFERMSNKFKHSAEATGEEMAKVSALAKELGADLELPATSASDAMSAMLEMSKGGLELRDTMASAKGVLQLSSAAQIDNATAAQIGARALKAFNLEGSKMAMISDLFAGSANETTAEITDMAQAFQAGASMANLAGLEIQEYMALLGLMGNKGIIGSDAGTSVKSFLLSLANPQSKAAIQTLEDLEINLYDATGAVRPFIDVVKDFDRALAPLTEEQKQRALSNIFGSDGIRTAAILFEEGAEGLKKMEDAISKQGSAAKAARAINEGFMGSLDGLKSSVETLLTSEGSKGLPGLTGAVKELTGWVNRLGDSPDPFKAVVAGAALTVAALGPSASGVAGVLNTVILLRGPYRKAAESIAASNVLIEGSAAAATGKTGGLLASLKALSARVWPVAVVVSVGMLGKHIRDSMIGDYNANRAATKKDVSTDFKRQVEAANEHIRRFGMDSASQMAGRQGSSAGFFNTEALEAARAKGLNPGWNGPYGPSSAFANKHPLLLGDFWQLELQKQNREKAEAERLRKEHANAMRSASGGNWGTPINSKRAPAGGWGGGASASSEIAPFDPFNDETLRDRMRAAEEYAERVKMKAAELDRDMQGYEARRLIAAGNLSKQDEVSLQMFSKKFGLLTDEDNKKRVLAEIDAQRAESERQTRDSLTERLAQMNEELEVKTQLTNLDRTIYEISQRRKAGEVVPADIERDLLTAARRLDYDSVQASGQDIFSSLFGSQMSFMSGIAQQVGQAKSSMDEYLRSLQNEEDFLRATNEAQRIRIQLRDEEWAKNPQWLESAVQATVRMNDLRREYEESMRMQDLVAGGFSRMFDSILQDGDAFASDLLGTVRSLVLDIAHEFLRQQFSGWISGALGGLFGGGGKGGANWKGIAGGISSIFRANGGPVTAGSPYIVGEHGPELVVPSQSGYVLSNPQSRAALAGGGDTVVINLTVQTPDAGSFRKSERQIGREIARVLEDRRRRA